MTPNQPKDAIRRRFSRAAATYDRHADLQQEAARLLAACLPADHGINRVLELGCGTGNHTRALLERFPQAQITSLDFSQEMLCQTRRKLAPSAGTGGRLNLLCQDAETLLAALAKSTDGQESGRFDLISSNAAIQWFSDPAAAFAGIRAGLRPGGFLVASIFGRRTLAELAAGLEEINGRPASLAAGRFPTAEQLTTMLTPLFQAVEISDHLLQRRFPDLRALLRHFQMTGTGGPAPTPPVSNHGGLRLTPGQYRQLAAWFAARPEGCAITFQILLVSCR